MISGATTALSLVILGLTGTIAAELADRNSPVSSVSRVPARIVASTTVQARRPSRSDIETRTNEILARPVFSPDRKPSDSGTKRIAGLPRLTGIVVTETSRIAIFAASSGGHPVVAEEGTHINAYEVKTITDAGVTVTGPAGAAVMRPMFDPAAPAMPLRPLPAQAPATPRK